MIYKIPDELNLIIFYYLNIDTKIQLILLNRYYYKVYKKYIYGYIGYFISNKLELDINNYQVDILDYFSFIPKIEIYKLLIDNIFNKDIIKPKIKITNIKLGILTKINKITYYEATNKIINNDIYKSKIYINDSCNIHKYKLTNKLLNQMYPLTSSLILY